VNAAAIICLAFAAFAVGTYIGWVIWYTPPSVHSWRTRELDLVPTHDEIAAVCRIRGVNPSEFALIYEDDVWSAHMGFRNRAVAISEAGGLWIGEGVTPYDALAALKVNAQRLPAR
jgi:hypothetical protein